MNEYRINDDVDYILHCIILILSSYYPKDVPMILHDCQAAKKLLTACRQLCEARFFAWKTCGISRAFTGYLHELTIKNRDFLGDEWGLNGFLFSDKVHTIENSGPTNQLIGLREKIQEHPTIFTGNL